MPTKEGDKDKTLYTLTQSHADIYLNICTCIHTYTNTHDMEESDLPGWWGPQAWRGEQ